MQEEYDKRNTSRVKNKIGKMKDKKIFVYVNAPYVCPSGYYRILQYIDSDTIQSVTVHGLMTSSVYKKWHYLSKKTQKLLSAFLFLFINTRTLYFLISDNVKATKGDILIINRTISPRYISFIHVLLLKLLCRKTQLIWDFDDNILQSGTCSVKEFNVLSETSKKIIVTHSFLKNTILEVYHNKVILLPTTDGDMCNYNLLEILEKRKKLFNCEICIIWVATSGGLIYLQRIIPILESTAKKILCSSGRLLRLKVVCNKPLETQTKFLKIDNILWDHDTAIECMKHAHIGIMPLIENEFTLGKGGFKLIQYLSIGLPVIASNVGFNKEIINSECGFSLNDKDDLISWEKAIISMTELWEKYEQLAIHAKKQYEDNYSFRNNKLLWDSILK